MRVKNFRILLSAVIVLGTCTFSNAQSVSNVRASQDPSNANQVIITYDLQPSAANQTFRIELKTSKDEFVAPLRMVSGDVGENIPAGNNKRIFWRAREELGLYSGSISFEVTSILMVSPLRLTSPKLSESFDPGTLVPIEWEGGFENSTIQIELFKSNLFNSKITTTPNNKRYDWSVPGDLPEGTDYKIKLYDVNAAADAVMSQNFGLTPSKNASKTKEKKEGKKGGKTGLIIGAIAVVGGGAAYLLTRPKDEDPTPSPPGGGETFEYPAPPPTPTGTIQQRRGMLTFSF